jgi:hypothetical protein
MCFLMSFPLCDSHEPCLRQVRLLHRQCITHGDRRLNNTVNNTGLYLLITITTAYITQISISETETLSCFKKAK